MKYAQLLTGLLIGTALGGAGVASTGGGGSMDKEAIKEIIRETISSEPKLIMDSVQKFQAQQQEESGKAASEALKDPETMKQILDSTNIPYIGPQDGKKVVVEFFDYNCPACKMMFEGIDKLTKEDKDVKVIFREFPIFGEVSENNSKFALAIWKLHPDKYYEFHGKMMKAQGKDPKTTDSIVTGMGLNLEKIKEESKKPEYAKVLEDDRALAQKLNIRGTPTLVVGDELVPHALDYNGLKEKLSKQPG